MTRASDASSIPQNDDVGNHLGLRMANFKEMKAGPSGLSDFPSELLELPEHVQQQELSICQSLIWAGCAWAIPPGLCLLGALMVASCGSGPQLHKDSPLKDQCLQF